MRLAALMTIAMLSAGCASTGSKPDALAEPTAAALGVNKGDFTVSNRKEAAGRTDYSVKTKAGAQYSCYVMGATPNTASCLPLAADKSAKPSTSGSSTCYPLQKAAGKC